MFSAGMVGEAQPYASWSQMTSSHLQSSRSDADRLVPPPKHRAAHMKMPQMGLGKGHATDFNEISDLERRLGAKLQLLGNSVYVILCFLPPPTSQTNILQDWDQFFHLRQCFWLIFFVCLGEMRLSGLCFLTSCIQLFNWPNSVFQGLKTFWKKFLPVSCKWLQYHEEERGCAGNNEIWEATKPKELETSSTQGVKELRGKKKKERDNFSVLRRLHLQQGWSKGAKE